MEIFFVPRFAESKGTVDGCEGESLLKRDDYNSLEKRSVRRGSQLCLSISAKTNDLSTVSFLVPTTTMIEPTCLVAAVLFVVSNLMGFSFFYRWNGGSEKHFTWTDYRDLNTDLIQLEFDQRNHEYFFEVCSGVLNAIAWMIFCIPVIQVAWVQSRRGQWLLGIHVAIAALALGGSVTELISRLMFIGTTSTSNWLATQFNLENWVEISNDATEAAEEGGDPTTVGGDLIGWRVLEMIHIVTKGFIRWIDTAEWFFLSAIFTLIYLSVVKSEEAAFSRNWARLGLLLGGMAFLNFVADAMRLHTEMTFSKGAIFFSAVSRIFVMPFWMLWLGRQLTFVKLQPQASALPINDGNNDDTKADDDDQSLFT